MFKKSFFRISILFCLSFLFINNTFALNNTDKLSIEKTINGYVNSWNKGDAKEFSTVFTEDADFVNIYGMHFLGKPEIESRHILLFQTFLNGSKLEVRNIVMREVKSDLVIVHVPWKLNGYRNPGSDLTKPGETREGIFTQVFLNDGKKWAITASHNTMAPK